MINRIYFVNAKVTDAQGYSFTSKLVARKSLFAKSAEVYSEAVEEMEKELLQRRPGSSFEVISFNRV